MMSWSRNFKLRRIISEFNTLCRVSRQPVTTSINTSYFRDSPSCNFNTSTISHCSSHNNKWIQVVSEAEKIVGYPTSYLSLKYLFSDEVSNIASHLRKLVGSSHPILKTAKKLVSNSHSSLNPRGLILLLISQTGNEMISASSEQIQEILRKQRSLAEIAEMIYMVQLIHTKLIELPSSDSKNSELSNNMEFGNKISVLSGDYLLANASMGLAKLRNTKVVEIIAESIRDFTQSEFIRCNGTLREKVYEGTEGWKHRIYYSSASLMEKSCQSVLELAGLPNELTSIGSNLGKNIGLAWQIQLDLESLSSTDNAVDLLSLPVIYFLKDNYNILQMLENNNSEYLPDKLKEQVLESGSVKIVKEMGSNYCENAIELLKYFSDSEARSALHNMMLGLKYKFS